MDKDIQYGYTGNNVHGILTDYASGSLHDVIVRNVESWHGSAIGIAVYKGSNAEFGGSIAVDNISAGTKMSDSQSEQLTLPNSPPFVCSVYIGPNSEADEYPQRNAVIQQKSDFLLSTGDIGSFYGHQQCADDMRMGDMPTLKSPHMKRHAKGKEGYYIGQDNHINFLEHYRLLMVPLLFTVIVVCCFLLCDGYSSRQKWKSAGSRVGYGSLDA